jgi:lantibiotic leader peptide-processing serine protease
MRNKVVAALVAAVAAAALTGLSPGAGASRRTTSRTYLVLYASGVSRSEARTAIKRVGGRILDENRAIGLASVRTSNPNFTVAASRSTAIAGTARDRVIGYSDPALRPKVDDVERIMRNRAAGSNVSTASSGEPLASRQWDMDMIHATASGSHATQQGSHDVLVGIVDTGIDSAHPDLAANFNHELSRNFTTDIELIDGSCKREPDRSCSDPANVDEGGHGTHVAGTVGAAINGLGIAGVAPGVSLVNLRAGQDSGFFFLQPSVDALTFAADNGVDVVNMSYYIDPWLYNCTDNPADSPEAQQEQATIIEATQRAVDYAHSRGVTLIGAAGNANTDLGNPTFDGTSPDYPPGTEYPRTVDNSCLDMPTEATHVLSVSALGPSKTKADYSNYGVEQTTVSAPGGYSRDFFGTPQYRTATNLVLSSYPEALARAERLIDSKGNPTSPSVVRDCQNGVCGTYVYLQGTSMAAPHATGVAALIVAEFGTADPDGGLTLAPSSVEQILTDTATDHRCPAGRVLDYPDRDESFTATCQGGLGFNGFYGHGIVDALAAVTGA